jgi:hypothetical protein
MTPPTPATLIVDLARRIESGGETMNFYAMYDDERTWRDVILAAETQIMERIAENIRKEAAE